MKLVERELGPHHVSCDIGCHLFSILPPFNIGTTTMGYGLGGAGAAAFNAEADKRAIAVMGDGGFWHNGLTCGVGNAVFNQSDNVTDHRRQRLHLGDRRPGHPVVARRQHDRAAPATRSRRRCAASASKWVRTITRTYDVAGMRDTLREALTTPEKGPKVIDRAVRVHAEQAAPREAADAARRSKAASAWCASASASTPTPAPAIIPASACRAARR